MNKIEYSKVKNYNYEQYIKYLLEKYGQVSGNYFTDSFAHNMEIKRKNEELYLHHIKEDTIANLSDLSVAKNAPIEYQFAENLVYANLLEHIFLHILIGEQNKGLGFGGAELMIAQANDFYNAENFEEKESVLSDGFEVLELLKERCGNSIAAYETLFEHNQTVFYELEDTLANSDRALVVIGTGLGKTTTALAYLRKYSIRGIVLGPNRIITDAWAKNKEVDVYTYQWFMNNYKTIDFSKYGVMICDEAHHCSAARWGEGIRYALDNGLIKVMGLTATPKENDKTGKKNFETSSVFFKGYVCKGFTVLDGIERSIIHDFSYVGAIYDTSDIKAKYSDIKDEKLKGELDLALNNTPTMEQIFRKHMPASKRKGIIFCTNIEAINEAEDIMRKVYPNAEYRRMHSLMDIEAESAREWFENTDEGWLLAVNMISEGAHYKGVNTIVMFRRTESSLVFNQQLGRIITLVRDEDPEAIVFDLVNNANNITESKSFAGSLKHAYQQRKERGGKQKSEQIIIEDYAEKISEILKVILDKKSGYREVYQISPETYEIIAKYPQVMLAANAINGSASSIYQACYGKVGIASGFYWCFVEDWENWMPKENLNSHGVWCIELNRYFKQIKEASECLNISRSSIIKSCKAWNIKAGGYHFCYEEDKEKWELTKTQYHNQRAVWCIETQTKYDSCADAARAVESRSSDISAVCRGEKQTCKNYHWCYYEDREHYIMPEKRRNGNYKRVRCIETGTIYDTMAEAERQTGVPRNDISAVCRGRQKTARGYHWEYATEGEII